MATLEEMSGDISAFTHAVEDLRALCRQQESGQAQPNNYRLSTTESGAPSLETRLRADPQEIEKKERTVATLRNRLHDHLRSLEQMVRNWQIDNSTIRQASSRQHGNEAQANYARSVWITQEVDRLAKSRKDEIESALRVEERGGAKTDYGLDEFVHNYTAPQIPPTVVPPRDNGLSYYKALQRCPKPREGEPRKSGPYLRNGPAEPYAVILGKIPYLGGPAILEQPN